MTTPTKVKINLQTNIEQAGHIETINEHYLGQMSKIDDDLFLQYNESNDENKSVILSLYANNIYRLQRKGNPQMDFIFDVNKDYVPGTYVTYEAGQMNIQVKTIYQNLSLDEINNKGELVIYYKLINGSIEFGNFELSIRFQSIVSD